MTSSARRASLGRFSDASLASPVKSSRCATDGSKPGRSVAAEKPSHPRYARPATFMRRVREAHRPARARAATRAGRGRARTGRMALRLAPPVQASGNGARNAAGASTSRYAREQARRHRAGARSRDEPPQVAAPHGRKVGRRARGDTGSRRARASRIRDALRSCRSARRTFTPRAWKPTSRAAREQQQRGPGAARDRPLEAREGGRIAGAGRALSTARKSTRSRSASRSRTIHRRIRADCFQWRSRGSSPGEKVPQRPDVGARRRASADAGRPPRASSGGSLRDRARLRQRVDDDLAAPGAPGGTCGRGRSESATATPRRRRGRRRAAETCPRRRARASRRARADPPRAARAATRAGRRGPGPCAVFSRFSRRIFSQAGRVATTSPAVSISQSTPRTLRRDSSPETIIAASIAGEHEVEPVVARVHRGDRDDEAHEDVAEAEVGDADLPVRDELGHASAPGRNPLHTGTATCVRIFRTISRSRPPAPNPSEDTDRMRCASTASATACASSGVA